MNCMARPNTTLQRLMLLIIAMYSVVQVAGCHPDPNRLNSKDLAEFMPISAGIVRASSVTLYEGLPHQNFEADLLKQELENKQTVLIREFPFYERPLPISEADIETLRQLATTASSFSTSPGAKSCGGFHPDYCLVWKDADATYEVLICFGCRDVMFFGPTQTLFAEIRKEAGKQFKSTLDKYREQRPEPTYGTTLDP
jgi:hypothetical protein